MHMTARTEAGALASRPGCACGTVSSSSGEPGLRNDLYAGVAGQLSEFSDGVKPLPEFFYEVIWDGDTETFVRRDDGRRVDQVNMVLLWDGGEIYAQR
jgi:hypothetical protein